eukprot:TRINITY_DN93465_c0_g1_i1.p2 TRINITY_DN93465_c0_g1~~TRINITY_DN93465_c0_g1_i1.p2  ORF type:complete len:150 (+),score=42.32 TRINITY_DN93465_c0_g1_i1:55-504(+)
MPRGFGHVLATAFASEDGGASLDEAADSPWKGESPEKIFGRMHPIAQDLIKKTPGFKQSWDEDMSKVLLQSKKKSVAEQQVDKANLEKNLKRMNAMYEADPDILEKSFNAVIGTPGLAICPAFLTPPPLARRQQTSRQEHADFLLLAAH